MAEPKIIVAGHVALDITPSFPDSFKGKSLKEVIKPGKIVDVGRAELSPGGCVTNTGLALKKFNADVKLMAKIGTDSFGKMITDSYKKYGCEPDFIVSDESTTSYTIVIAPPGCDRCFFHDTAANNSFKSTDFDYEEIGKAQYFHFGYPTLMREFYLNGGAELIKLFKKVKELGLVSSLDLAAIDPEGEAEKADWKDILKKVLPYVDFFVPSIEELCYILEPEKYEEWQTRGDGDICMSLSLNDDVIPVAREALSLGCRAVMLKCGAAGMYLVTSGEDDMKNISPSFSGKGWGDISVFEESFVPERILSGTGAGDTSIAAFLYGVSHGFSPELCLNIAAGTGASCITEYDTLSGLLPIDELIKKIDGGWKKQHFIKP